MHVGGGFVPLEIALIEAPVFTLYGDGTVLFQPSVADGRMAGPGMAMPAYVRARMSTEQIDALLRFALVDGGLLDARESYMDIGVADAPNTIFTIDAGGVQKVVTIAALGFDATGGDAADRAKFAGLADLLDSFEEQVAAGNVITAEPWEVPRYRGYLSESFEGEVGDFMDWPWADVTPSDFQGRPDSPARVAALSPDQVSELVDEMPSGPVGGLLVEAPDGTKWHVSIRPVLPDEEAVPSD
jgi:hypothetical protein